MVPASAQARAPNPESGPVILRLAGLTKQFGQTRAVDSFDLEVRSGEVLGLLGPNGAGKSTVVGMILGLVKPTSGQVVYGNLKPSEIGAIIENPAFYPFMSGRDNLRAIARLTHDDDRQHIDRLLELVGLQGVGRKKVGAYSLGMKQRLGLASTLIADPRLIILDEPTNGLDPAGQEEIRQLIPRLAHEGRAVIIASHLLHDAEQVCTRVVVMQAGRLRRSGTLDELLGRKTQLEIRVARPEAALQVLRGLEGVAAVSLLQDGLLLADAAPESASLISRALAEHGLYVESMVVRHPSLEDVFFEITRQQDSEV